MSDAVNIKPESVAEPKVDSKIKSQLPEPKGWKILVAMPEVDEKTEGGIVKATQTIRDEEVSNISGYVLKLGPDCYKDFRAYSGTRMKMYGQEFRLINDDTVEAVVEDPTGVVRA